MKITRIQFRNIHGNKQLRALASITLDGVLTIDDIAIVQLGRGFTVRYPRNKYRQYIVLPRTPKATRQIENKLLHSYRKFLCGERGNTT
jgi:DNA-binding cell septation regulator SpoVG